MPILFIWPLISLIFFAKMRFDRALAMVVIGGYLFLPSNYGLHLPVLPEINKTFVISMAVWLGWLVYRPSVPMAADSTPGHRRTEILTFVAFALIFLTPVVTVLTNSGAIVIGESFRPGLGFDDLRKTILTLAVPLPLFFVARSCLATEESRRGFLEVLVLLALVYTPLVLFEIRMSPQLHIWVYGYFPHEWLQHIRGGGFRPVVFLPHGLWLGIFLLVAIIAATAVARGETDGNRGILWLLAGFWLFAILAVSRNLGAFVLALGLLPLVLFGWRRLQLRIVMIIAILFLTFPAVRQADLVPVQDILAKVEAIAPERTSSLATRFENEDRLLARALEKPVAGWGGWGRARVYDENGRDISITDGLWIIILGERGWIGFLAFFGLFASPLLLLPGIRRRTEVSHTTAGMALIIAAMLIYSIPNAAILPYTWLLLGGLLGAIRAGSTGKDTTLVEDLVPGIETPPGRLRYTRFRPDTRSSSIYRRPVPETKRTPAAPQNRLEK